MDPEKEPSSYVDSFINGIPLVGHIKGGMHYATGDIEGGRTAMKAATRTSAVVAGGVVGFSILGPVAAVCGGAISGLASDAVITAYDTECKGTPQPYGSMEAVADTQDRDKLCKAGATLVADGLIGYGAGSAVAHNGSVIATDAVKNWSYFEKLSYNKVQNAAFHVWKTSPNVREAVWSSIEAPMAWYGGKNIQKKSIESCCDRCKW